ncbi:hypothetical protein [Arthrobacter sp. fls2-241-R2A-200]|uniref:hypothetical protein n=1 Tax=Arthrobacter sp. fls2-241-R2A-200 TaxID=3040281 RepID=UPI00254D8EA1|nr:hypothetical protein [Arthrobacter sp. fls2-241-R2A-200]
MSVGLIPAATPPTFNPLECASRSHDVQRLAWRIKACVDLADTALASLRRAQMEDWQSPAGQAYRTTVALQAAALMRARGTMEHAVAMVLRYSRSVSVSGGTGP